MRKQSAVLILALSFTVFSAGGCAKQSVVKSDDPLVPQKAAADKNKADKLKTDQLMAGKLNAEELKSAEMKPVSSSKNGSSQENIDLKPIPNASQLQVALDVIYFSFDSYVLSQDARNSLAKNAELMKKDPNFTVRIEGNCDERGSDEYNLALGESRAKSAKQYLVTMGIPEKRLSVISYGKEKPVAMGHDENSWAKNRRDEFVITMK